MKSDSIPDATNYAKDHQATPAYDLLTVDVWDTLLRRRCHPDSVKLHLSRYLALHYANHLPPSCRDSWSLLQLRQQAEKELGDISRSRGFDDEYQHIEVYRRWLALAGLHPFPHGKAALENLLVTLEQVELAQEEYVSYADPTIVATLNQYSAQQFLFLSDFYLPASAIRTLLDQHQLSHLFSEGVVSCEIGLNKRSGRLYRHLHQTRGVQPERHLHIGDNLLADVTAAHAVGVKAIHYMPHAEHDRRQRREADFHARANALRAAIQELHVNQSSRLSAHQQIAGYGRSCSLLLIAFVLYVMERAIADGVTRLYFFTREGEFFQNIYQKLADQDVLGFSPPSTVLLQVSRIATFAGSLREFSLAELMRLWNQYSVQSPNALFKSLGMNPDLFKDQAIHYKLTMTQPVQYPWRDQRITVFLGDERVRTEIEQQLSQKKKELLAYLATAGLFDQPEKIGIVDIGWRGTIQDNLAYALPQATWHGYYLALNHYLNSQPENVLKNAFGPNLNQSEDYCHLLDCVAPIEMLCNSINGSVVGYGITEDNVHVFREIDEQENRIHKDFIHQFQAGVLDTVPFWADFIRTHAYSSDELRPVALEIWSSLIEQPPSFLTQAYFRLNHNETFGVGSFDDKRRLLTKSDILRAFVSRKYRLKIHNFLEANGWLPGLLACPDIDPAFRNMLRRYLQIRKLRNFLR